MSAKGESFMRVTVTGKHVKLTDGIKGYTEDKLKKLGKYLDEDTEVKVTVSAGKNRQKVEVMIPNVNGHTIRVEEEQDNLYPAIDLVCDKLSRQIIKYKDKYFQLFADKVSRNAVLADSYMIWTNSEQLAQEYIFEKKEQFVFIKYITRKEIGAVKIMKTPVLDFKDIEQSEEIIEGDALDSWLSELI